LRIAKEQIKLFHNLIKKAANQVRILADQTLRAIQPINCSGLKCANSMIPVNSIIPAMQEIDMLMPNLRQAPMPGLYDFSFKQSDNKIRNLRGIR